MLSWNITDRVKQIDCMEGGRVVSNKNQSLFSA